MCRAHILNFHLIQQLLHVVTRKPVGESIISENVNESPTIRIASAAFCWCLGHKLIAARTVVVITTVNLT